jgi:hypothetical protein
MPSEKDITVVDEIINTFDADVVRVITDPDLFGAQWHTMAA